MRIVSVLFFLLFFFYFPAAAQPVVSTFSPASGSPGTSVVITGNGFSSIPGNNIVYFGSGKAVVTTASTNSLTVTVPNGATHEPISVMTNGLIAFSAKPFVYSTGSGNINAGSFADSVGFASNPHGYIAIGDIDGDNKTDVLNTSTSVITILKNNSVTGTISFAPKTELFVNPLGQPVSDVTLFDLDGDGLKEIIAGNPMQNTVMIFRNISTPGNILLSTQQNFTTGDGPAEIGITDINNDGKPDIVTTNSNNTITVLQNTSTVGSISFAAKTDFATPQSPVGIAIADIDGDGRHDVVTSNGMSGNGNISVFRNTSTASTISFATRFDHVAGGLWGYLTTGDYDMNGKIDIALSDGAGTSITVIQNNSTPGVISLSNLPLLSGGWGYGTVVSMDLTGDGKPEIITGGGMSNKTYVFNNTSTTGVISFASAIGFNADGGHRVETGDLDGDGRPELITGVYSPARLTVYRNLNPILPLSLLRFTCTKKGLKSILSWQTTNEKNTSHFEIEHSSNGVNYTKIETAKSTGTGNSVNDYYFEHNEPAKGYNYYRIKIVDADGKFSYSGINSVRFESVALGVYPNPVRDILTIEHPESKVAQISILDINGKIVHNSAVQANAMETKINLTKLTPGNYIVRWSSGFETFTTRLQIKR